MNFAERSITPQRRGLCDRALLTLGVFILSFLLGFSPWGAIGGDIAQAHEPAPEAEPAPGAEATPEAEPAPGAEATPEAEPAPGAEATPRDDAWPPAMVLSNEEEPHWGRAFAEAGVMLGIGVSWYWINMEVNKKDWDWPPLLGRVTGESMSFDNNTILFNQIYHPLTGMVYQGLARANGLSMMESLLISFTGSTVWEMLFELPEKVSLNDLIVTPGAGLSMGEASMLIGRYLTSNPTNETPLGSFSKYFVGLPGTFHQWLDGEPLVTLDESPDHLGLSRRYWHRFQIRVGGGTVLNNSAVNELTTAESEVSNVRLLELGMEVKSIPRHLRIGRRHGWMLDGGAVELRFLSSASDRGFEQTSFFSSAAILGYFREDVEGDELEDEDTLDGYALFFSLGSSYDLTEFDSRVDEDDRAILNMVRLHADIWGLMSGFKVRLRFGASPDFSALTALSYPRAQAEAPDETFRSVLKNQGYAFHFGGSLSAQLELMWLGFSLSGEWSYGRWFSADGLDRYEERVTRDDEGEEALMRWRARLQYSFSSPMGLLLSTTLGGFWRESILGSYTTDRDYMRVVLGIGFEL